MNDLNNTYRYHRNNRSTGFSTREATWERPFTAKRYLHPPYTQNMMTMWPDFKVVCGDVVETTGGYHSAAFRILAGKDAKEIPFENTIYGVRDDGIPIHRIAYDFKEYSLEMECFCNVARVTTAFTKVTVTNPNAWEVQDCLSVMARTGLETLLTGMGSDEYCHFNPNVNNWGFMQTDWIYKDGIMTDGKYQIQLQTGDFHTHWQGDAPGLLWRQRHLLMLDFCLAPGESKSFYLAFGCDGVTAFDYAHEKAQAQAFWERELSKIHTFINGQPGMVALQRNLVAQMLQMFSYPAGKNYILPRQGGLQRVVWPVEALEFLIALDRIGNFYDYTEKAYDTFFNIMQVKEGEDAGVVLNLNGQKWASNTGGALWGVSRHVLFRNKREVFLKFRPSMLLGFEWMQNQRKKTLNGQYAGKGIFPPMQASDWEGEYQSWCWTDGNNLMGYEWLAKVFEHFDDPRAAEIRSAYTDYMSCLEEILNQQIFSNPLQGEINISNKAGIKPLDPSVGPVGDSAINLLRAKVIKADSECAQLLENYYRNRGYGQKGLMGLMNDGLVEQGLPADYWAGHTWYMSACDISWFYAWLETGQTEKAQQCLEGQLKYTMTPEYYMCERYADNDPYFTPWLPNASANGRTLMMLLDFYK